MKLKRAINRALGTAGVQLVRTATLGEKERVRRDLRRQVKTLSGKTAAAQKGLTAAEQRAAAAEQRLTAAEQRAAAAEKAAAAAEERAAEAEAKLQAATRKRPPTLPADYHPDMPRIWAAVKGRTMIGHAKLNSFCDAARYVSTVGLEGDIVECGVWRGGAMLGCAMVLDSLGDHSRDLYLYDTYSGMSDATERDVHIWNGRTAEEELAAKSKGAPIWAIAPIDDVTAAFDTVAYPKERLHFVEGKVEDTIPQTAPERISILRLDTDWYESTKHELDHLYDRLVPGGVLIIDDYGSWQGSRDATDEFISNRAEPLLLNRVGRGRVAVKPGPAESRR